MDYKILIVEDESKIREIIYDYFSSKNQKVYLAENGIIALDLIENMEFDAIIMDIMMPKLDGFSLCKKIRKEKDTPIIFLTALSDEEDKLHGYELGADDYVTKPFSLSILYAKAMALIKRYKGNVLLENKLKINNILVDTLAHKVFVGNEEINLTPKEYSLLEYLIKNKNIVMSREQLLVKCWGYDYEGDSRAVDTHIKKLREKLGKSSECIKTVIKFGYKMEE